MRLKIQRLKELKVFNSLKLFIVIAAKIFVELISRIKLFAEILVDVFIKKFKIKASLVVYYLGFSVS